MAVIIEVVASAVIFGILMLAILTIVGNLNMVSSERTFTLNMETNIVTLARLLEHDFVKIGYKCVKPAITLAESTRIIFKSDLENNGVVRTVQYYLGDPNDSIAIKTKNPRDRILFRNISGKGLFPINVGITKFNLAYFDSSGASTTDVSKIKSIQIKVNIENPVPYDTIYVGSYWEKTIYPRNL